MKPPRRYIELTDHVENNVKCSDIPFRELNSSTSFDQKLFLISIYHTSFLMYKEILDQNQYI